MFDNKLLADIELQIQKKKENVQGWITNEPICQFCCRTKFADGIGRKVCTVKRLKIYNYIQIDKKYNDSLAI